MIRKIFCTNHDRQHLRKNKGGETASEDIPVDFSRVIIKPWGYEYIICQSGDVAVWRLFIRFGEATSLHCHLLKQTMMIVLSGECKCHTLQKPMILRPFDTAVIAKGAFHSIESLSTDGTDIIEVNSPPLLTDLLRLEDKYGRAGKPY